MLKKLERLFGKILVLAGLKEKKKRATPQFWRESPDFVKMYKRIKGKTLVTPDRCFMIRKYALLAKSIDGDFAEVGVYKGGTARLTADSVPEKKLYLFDTFEGMPETADVDIHQKGDFDDTSLESVKNFLGGCSNVEFCPGFFPQTAQALERNRFSFVHIDVDIYQSVKDSLEFFYPRLSPGGVMVFDDYEWKDTPGVKKALDEFFLGKPEKPIVSTLYQCTLTKS